MTNNTGVPVAIRKSNSKILLAILAVLLLLLGYGTAFIVLPISILSQYQQGNCDSVLSLGGTYTTMYPAFLEDRSIVGPMKECEVYIQAVSNEEQMHWQEAYDTYQAYLTTYPNGLYGKESHEHSAIVLMHIVEEQYELKQYESVLSNLSLITSAYHDTSVNTKAWAFFPSVYTSWGSELREMGEFERAVQIFSDYKVWGETNQKAEWAAAASREVAQSYLEWGSALLSQKEFELALAKFDLAISAGPQSQPNFVEEAKSAQRQVYVEWGNELVASSQFPSAIEKFERGVALLGENGDDVTRDALINGHIQWALHLNTLEDFHAALDQLEIAADLPSSPLMIEKVETAKEETYLDFSASSGSQAMQEMQDALERICEEDRKPTLKIFGLNKDLVGVGVYGVDAKLSEDLVAKTPGEMHYVACIELQKKVVAEEMSFTPIIITNTSFLRIPLLRQRIQVFWKVSLFDIVTGRAVKSTVLPGGTPPPFPNSRADYTNGRYEGTPPTTVELNTWLQSALP